MKIKTKKTMSLPQLIEWGFKNDVTGAMFSDDRVEAKRIRFEVGILVSIHGDIHKGDTFTVEVEEEITEDTVLHKLTRYTAFGFKGTKYNTSINDVKSHDSVAFYIMNDDLTMTLIWRNGKLVE